MGAATACLDLTQWTDAKSPVGAVAVNVSAQQVMAPAFAHTVTRVLADTGADPARLCLEVTESLFLSDTTRALAVMKELSNLGVQLSLDDFGTGYSSLSYLRHFPVDIVKVDRSFTANLTTDKATRSIVRAVIDLSHVLGLDRRRRRRGNRRRLQQIRTLGADHAQGCCSAKPSTQTPTSRTIRNNERPAISDG